MTPLAPFEKAPVKVSVEGPVAMVTLEGGDRFNALSVTAMKSLKEIALRFRDDTTVAAIILTGIPAFSSGADLSDPEHAARAQAPLLERRELLRLAPDLCAAWEALDQITIAAIEGFCIGGALALAVSCDFRIAGTSAHVRLPEIPFGWNLNWNAQPRIVNLIGPAKAKRFIIFGERVEAPLAKEWGLIDEVVPDGEAVAAALTWAKKSAALPPIAVRMTKRSITHQATALNKLACSMDNDQYILASMTDDHREAMAAYFEKRAGVFVGR